MIFGRWILDCSCIRSRPRTREYGTLSRALKKNTQINIIL